MPQSQNGASVQLSEVSHSYSKSELVLDSIQFAIQSGEFVSILGPSGCGKSTLLRFLAALDRPTSGRIQFGPAQSVPVRGFVFQEPRLLPWRTVLENVKLPLELQGQAGKTSHQSAIAALERVGLADSILKYPAQLSGGMKMRVSVARALVFQPSLLLLDEPFSALDETTRQVIQDDLRSLWRSLKMTVIFVTHSISEAVYLSNRVIILSKRPARLLSDQSIQLPLDRSPEIRLDNRFNLEIQKINPLLSLKGPL